MQFVQTKFHCVVYRIDTYISWYYMDTISPTKRNLPNKQIQKKRKKKKKGKREEKRKTRMLKFSFEADRGEPKRQRIEALGESTPCVLKSFVFSWNARFAVTGATQTRLLPPGLINFVASRLTPLA